MESESVLLLKEIRQILYWIGAAISIGVVFWIASSSSRMWIQFKAAVRKAWIYQASEYFDKADYDSLLTHCEERQSSYPNDATAVWWLARCYKMKDIPNKSDELFSKVFELEPTWKEEHVDPFVSTESNNPTNKLLKKDAEKRTF